MPASNSPRMQMNLIGGLHAHQQVTVGSMAVIRHLTDMPAAPDEGGGVNMGETAMKLLFLH